MAHRSSAPAHLVLPAALRFPAAPPDWQVGIITGVFIVVVLWFGGRLAFSYYQGLPPDRGDLLIVVLLGATMLWRWLNSVRLYVLHTGAAEGPRLLIRRWAPWRTVPIDLGRLVLVDPQPVVRTITSLALLNMGSLFGWAGAASVPGIGPVLAFATNARRAVTLELAPPADRPRQTKDGQPMRGPILLLSPRDPAALAEALAPFWRPAPARRPAAGALPVSRSGGKKRR